MNVPPRRVRLADNTLDHEEMAAVSAVLASGWLSVGAETRFFEEEFACTVGVPDAVAVSSGTAALHLAILSLGLAEGDEVILPSLSFVASAAVVALHGAIPVFADVRSASDLTIDPHDVERLITSRTRAIIVMHYGGFAADLVTLSSIAAAHGVALIEDAAHAPAVSFGTSAIGSLGLIGCFSFHATKNMTTGEGGMVVAREPQLLDRIRSMRSHSISSPTFDRVRGGTDGYNVTALGLNYRPTEISSAIGRVQLRKLSHDRRHRRSLVSIYRQLLREIPGLVVPFDDYKGESAFHLMPILLPPSTNRRAFQAIMREKGIDSSVHYPPTHRFEYYEHRFGSTNRRLPITDAIADRLVSLPLHARMADEDVALVAESTMRTVEALRAQAEAAL